MPIPAVLTPKTKAAVAAVAQARADLREHTLESEALADALTEDITEGHMNAEEARDLAAAYGVAFTPPAEPAKAAPKPKDDDDDKDDGSDKAAKAKAKHA
jgi:hypothetical protein